MDLLLHGGIGLLLGIFQVHWGIVLALIVGKEIYDYLDYGLFSWSDIIYGVVGYLIGAVLSFIFLGK